MASDIQQQFDFPRAEQLAILSDLVLPDQRSRDGKPVAQRHMIAVLKCIDDHARGRACWIAFDTMARKTGWSRATVIRTVAALESLSVIVRYSGCEPGTDTRCNQYTLVWSELSLYRAAKTRAYQSSPGRLCSDFQSSLGSDQSSLGSDQSSLGSDQSSPGGTLTVLNDLTAGRPAGGGRWTDEERQAIAARLQAAGYERWEGLLREAETTLGRSVVEVQAVLDEFEANRRRFAGPGAIASRLRSGAWPVAGIKPPASGQQPNGVQKNIARLIGLGYSTEEAVRMEHDEFFAEGRSKGWPEDEIEKLWQKNYAGTSPAAATEPLVDCKENA